MRLTKGQHEVLNIICDTYQKSVSEYTQEALVRAMQSDIEDGDFCDVLLDKITDDNDEGDNANSKRKDNDLSNPFESKLDDLQI